jgi:hypothetical protein
MRELPYILSDLEELYPEISNKKFQRAFNGKLEGIVGDMLMVIADQSRQSIINDMMNHPQEDEVYLKEALVILGCSPRTFTDLRKHGLLEALNEGSKPLKYSRRTLKELKDDWHYTRIELNQKRAS